MRGFLASECFEVERYVLFCSIQWIVEVPKHVEYFDFYRVQKCMVETGSKPSGSGLVKSSLLVNASIFLEKTMMAIFIDI